MTIHQILQAERILCSVPDRRKAEAVKSYLGRQDHPRCARLGAQSPSSHYVDSRCEQQLLVE